MQPTGHLRFYQSQNIGSNTRHFRKRIDNMGLFDFIRSIFGGSTNPPPSGVPSLPVTGSSALPDETAVEIRGKKSHPPRQPGSHVQLRPLEYRPSTVVTPRERELTRSKPYAFARREPRTGEWLDQSRDHDERWLDYYGLPKLTTPEELADWLGMPLGRLVWLTHRMEEGFRAKDVNVSHYHYQWKKKRSGGWRLLEAPKAELKAAQSQILREILDLVPAHPAAHGFVRGRSILSNAAPHVGSKFILKLDLENFYPSVKYNRVVAIFRSLGFSREVSIWLSRLTVTAPPWSLEKPMKHYWEYWQYLTHHLPQGAPTSPALANLSAFALDVRLSGIAEAYNLKYTRYADDLTFSGPGLSIPALNDFIPLTTKIIQDERFHVNKAKRKIIRNSQRQAVTGVVVNEKVNVSRKEFDRLKATLYNCVKLGPQTQNRESRPDFSAQLRGRIAHVMQLNRARGEKLLQIYNQIRW